MAVRMTGLPQQNFSLKSAQQKQQSQGLKQNQVSFKSEEEQFKNPVNKNMERTLAAVTATGITALFGIGSGFAMKATGLAESIAKRTTKDLVNNLSKNSNKIAIGTGLAVGAFTALNTIPGAIYQSNKSATVQKENMETFHAGNQTELAVQGRMKEDSKDPNVSTRELVDNFFKVQSAKNGKTTGLIVSQ